METDFTYEQLSPAAFEQLAVALAESVIGAGMEVYGPGPDEQLQVVSMDTWSTRSCLRATHVESVLSCKGIRHIVTFYR